MRNVLGFKILTSDFFELPEISKCYEEQLLMRIRFEALKLKYLLSDANIRLLVSYREACALVLLTAYNSCKHKTLPSNRRCLQCSRRA